MRILCLAAVLALASNAACSLKVQGCLPRCGVEEPDGGTLEGEGKGKQDKRQAALEERASQAEEKAEAADRAVAVIRKEQAEAEEKGEPR